MDAGACRNCGASLGSNQAFCTECGTPVQAPQRQSESHPSAPQPGAEQTSLQRSLAGLGIPVGLSTIVGFFGALIVGVIVPRVLPFILPIFYPILDELTGGSPDPVNRFAMTSLTFLSSFVVSFVFGFLPRTLRRG